MCVTEVTRAVIHRLPAADTRNDARPQTLPILRGFAATRFNPFGLWFFLGWSIVAGFVLRQTWQPVRVETPSGGLRGRIGQRFPRLGAPLPLRAIGVAAAGSIALMAGYGWTTGDTLARYGMVIVVVMLGAIAMLLWLTES